MALYRRRIAEQVSELRERRSSHPPRLQVMSIPGLMAGRSRLLMGAGGLLVGYVLFRGIRTPLIAVGRFVSGMIQPLLTAWITKKLVSRF